MNPTETLLRRLAAACMYGQDNPAFAFSDGTRAEIRAAAQAARAHIDRLDFDANAPRYKTALSPFGHVGILAARQVPCKGNPEWFFDCKHIGGRLETFHVSNLKEFVI